MFTTETKGNTLYVKRRWSGFNHRYIISPGFVLINVLVIGLCFAPTKVPVPWYLPAITLAINLVTLYYDYSITQRNMLLTITRRPEDDKVIVNNKIIENSRYIYNVAHLLRPKEGYNFYLKTYSGDDVLIADHILSKEELFDMMEVVGVFLDIPVYHDR